MANERRLIDANAIVVPKFDMKGRDLFNQGYCQGKTDGILEVKALAPTVDAVEVVHGRWEDFCNGKMCCCSACKGEFDNTCNEIHGEWEFCPNCGAKMDGERK